ncbi:MAG: hypothetical protein GX427_05025 [Actinomycetales bacterium]|nr:hypothetical protein [Actinomycetales bacterium]
MDLLRAYRSSGADLPFGNPLAAHDVAMEGYFWRITDAAAGRVAIALIGVNRGPRGPWATLGLATHGGNPFLAVAAHDGAEAHPHRLGARAGRAFHGDHRSLHVRLDGGALDAVIDAPVLWPLRRWGGSSVFHAVPGLNQYWHPWLLGGRASGRAVVEGEEWAFTDAQVYGEKNWGRGGFPESWWWGQAQAFDEPAACVAFAGGQVYAGPLRTEVTGLVVRLPDGVVVRLGNPVVSPVAARVDDTTWRLRGHGHGWEIDVDAEAPLHAAHVLPVPLPHAHRNTAGAIEHLAGRLRTEVRRRGRVVWRGESGLAGLEHGGLGRAEAELRRRGAPPGEVGAPPGEVGSPPGEVDAPPG